MKLLEIMQPSNELVFINPRFIIAVWPSGKGDTTKLRVSEFDGNKNEITAKGSLKDVAKRINKALKDRVKPPRSTPLRTEGKTGSSGL